MTDKNTPTCTQHTASVEALTERIEAMEALLGKVLEPIVGSRGPGDSGVSRHDSKTIDDCVAAMPLAWRVRHCKTLPMTAICSYPRFPAPLIIPLAPEKPRDWECRTTDDVLRMMAATAGEVATAIALNKIMAGDKKLGITGSELLDRETILDDLTLKVYLGGSSALWVAAKALFDLDEA